MIEAADVFGWLGLFAQSEPTEAETAAMESVIAAVVAHTGKLYTAPDTEGDPPEVDDDWKLGHIMQCARLWQRKKSPAGIIDLAEFGGIRVTALDRDVETLLSPFKKFALG